MPWFALRHVSEDDLRAVYRFVRDPGPAGVAPEEEPTTAYIVFVPLVPARKP